MKTALGLAGAAILLVLTVSSSTIAGDRYDQMFGSKVGVAGNSCAAGARKCMQQCKALASSNTGKPDSPAREKYCWEDHCSSILKSEGC
ncbi:MAG TPA: hypothetical protein VGF29_06780 [Hyphomicrobiaceae bacterium]|jgi:hypothetical protein